MGNATIYMATVSGIICFFAVLYAGAYAWASKMDRKNGLLMSAQKGRLRPPFFLLQQRALGCPFSFQSTSCLLPRLAR